MALTDPIADMLSRIRNANGAQQTTVVFPHSRLKEQIVQILKDEGFVRTFKVVESQSGKQEIKVYLKYDELRRGSFRGIHRISRPGLRHYVGYRDLGKFKSGFGISIISTSSGIMTDSQAREKKVGGELLCSVW